MRKMPAGAETPARRSFRLALAVALTIGAFGSVSQAGLIQDVSAIEEEIQLGEKLHIGFRLSQPATTTLTVLDSDIRPVKSYQLGLLQPGAHKVNWDATDEEGKAVALEAYTWRIVAKGSSETDTWEPASLYTRPIENISRHQWDLLTRNLSYRTPVAMRVWVRIGLRSGPCMRLLAEGEPRPRGEIAESWDGLDESGAINLLERDDWIVSIFGYRLPQPCVIVSGAGPLPKPRGDATVLSRLTPAPSAQEALWQRRRAYWLGERVRPILRLQQVDAQTFRAFLDVPADLKGQEGAILGSVLQHRVRLKWYLDGECGTEEYDAAVPSLITFPRDRLGEERKHFVTANLVTSTHLYFVASLLFDAAGR